MHITDTKSNTKTSKEKQRRRGGHQPSLLQYKVAGVLPFHSLVPFPSFLEVGVSVD